jgi:hypothetical protein
MSPTMSPSDHVNQLWARRRERKSAFDLLANSPEGTEEACEVANRDIRNVEVVLECELTALGCIHAAGAVLLTEIEDNPEDEAFDGFYRGLLRAIRPHLVGDIAEDADRVLAEKTKKSA